MKKMQNVPFLLATVSYVPVIYTSRLQSKIATGKRSLSHRAFSLTVLSERASSVRFIPDIGIISRR